MSSQVRRRDATTTPLKIDLVERFRDYAPVRELAAERWEELETATGGSPIGRFSRWKENPAAFWGAFAPFLTRSPLLRTRFLDYCEDESVVLECARALVALSRLRPGSSLVLDCCKRVLAAEFDGTEMGSSRALPRSTVVASKCLATQFSEDSSAVDSDHCGQRQSAGGGRPQWSAWHRNWPAHEVVAREYQNLLERNSSRADCLSAPNSGF